ncbi:MAG: TauD/TfdA family dioxygenase [Alphaproteobacteria bacterium]|nr:TauD/TfdA family dioxygenase [Alphaproteobacteria bacterium]
MGAEPRVIDTPAAWKGPEIDWRREGLHVLTAAEIDEVDAALRHLRGLGDLDLPAITPATFPLPTLGAVLARYRDDLRFGRGFKLLRGLPRERWSADDIARLYYGLGVHIGVPMTQSRQGERLGHVIDISDVDRTVRGYQFGGGQLMHTDSCDIIGLMCLRAAKSGGASRIVSSVAVHNELVRRRPDLARLHYAGFTYRRNELDAKLGRGVVVPPVPIASYSLETGEFSSYLGTNYAMMAAKAGDAVLTDLQREAFDELHRIASSPEFYLDMQIGEGDIQFLNNRLMLHGRTAYEDHPELQRRRHMIRLWLQIPQWPALPERQTVHTAEDRDLWSRFRTPRMELPSHFFADVERRRAAAVAIA